MNPKDPMRTDSDKQYAVHIQAFDTDISFSNGPSTAFRIIALSDVTLLSVEIDDSLKGGCFNSWLSAGSVI